MIPAGQEEAFRNDIAEELEVFSKLGMMGFMLGESELVSWCKDNDMAIGPARGSVGGSRVAYVTDITDLNPETWHTVFSRFCNADREEIGDQITRSPYAVMYRKQAGELANARCGCLGCC